MAHPVDVLKRARSLAKPDGMSHEGSVGTGTVMRPAKLDEYARSAGFSGVSVLPVENDLWRFHELKQ